MPENTQNGSNQQNPLSGAGQNPQPTPSQQVFQSQQQFAAQQQAAASARGAHAQQSAGAPAPASAGAQPGATHEPARRPQPRPAGAPTAVSGQAAGTAKAQAAKNRKIFIGVCVGAVAVILIACAIIFGTGLANRAFFDSSAKEGQATYKTAEEIEAERNRQMQEGMLNISIASVIKFENGTSPGTAYIENVPSNKYVMKVTITTDNNGEVVYQSGGIKPDSFIETITLSQPLAAGTYPATATFTAYNPDTLEEIGQAGAKVTLVVES